MTFAGKEIPCDVIPIPEFVKVLPGRNSSATHELVFLAFQLPPLGSKSYYVDMNTSNDGSVKNSKTNEWFIENEVNYIKYKYFWFNKFLIPYVFCFSKAH